MNMKQAFRIAVLDFDKTVPLVSTRYGATYGGMFVPLLQSAATRANYPLDLQFSAWQPRIGHFPDPAAIDAIIVTGSISAAYDLDEWIVTLSKFIEKVYLEYPQVKIFATCFGHQLIGHVLLRQHGVVAELNPKGLQVGIRSVALDRSISEYFLKNTRGITSMRLQVIHGDHVRIPETGLPQGWYTFGSSDCCVVHGLFQPGRVLTIQGHFEFNAWISKHTVEHLFTEEKGYKKEWLEMATASIESGEDDSEIMADVLHAFFTEGGAPEPAPMIAVH